MTVICEDLPDKNNYLELDKKNKDNTGMFGIKLHYKLSDNSKKMLVHGIKNSKALKNAGAIRVRFLVQFEILVGILWALQKWE